MKCRNCKQLRWAEEYPGRPFFGWCDNVNDSPDMDMERECRCFEPATNADIVRRMSDRRLEKFLWKVFRAGTAESYGSSFAPECFLWDLDWLQSPAEEDI